MRGPIKRGKELREGSKGKQGNQEDKVRNQIIKQRS
jgi:hypothetical protein